MLWRERPTRVLRVRLSTRSIKDQNLHNLNYDRYLALPHLSPLLVRNYTPYASITHGTQRSESQDATSLLNAYTLMDRTAISKVGRKYWERTCQ